MSIYLIVKVVQRTVALSSTEIHDCPCHVQYVNVTVLLPSGAELQHFSHKKYLKGTENANLQHGYQFVGTVSGTVCSSHEM